VTERSAVLDEVLARRQVFSGFQGRGDLVLEHKADKLTVPVEVTLSEDLVLEAKGEVSHFLLPFQGEVRLVCSDSATLLHTNIGTYDLAMDPAAQTAARAFLLSLAGGGDWLLWWLAGRDCDLKEKTLCEGVEIELEPHGRLPTIARWDLSEASRGASFTGRVDEYEPGTAVARILSGFIQPQEITVYMKYTDISEIPGLDG
jgi:hypothetical protein